MGCNLVVIPGRNCMCACLHSSAATLLEFSVPLTAVCSVRPTGAMLEARAHAGPGSLEAEAAASALQLALSDALQGGMGATERCHALSALIWAQVTPTIRRLHGA